MLNILCFQLRITGCLQHHALTRSGIGRKRAQKGSDKPMSHVRQLQDYRLTTAEILYHLPDHPSVLQSYIWQDLDIAPKYPELHKFLDFWTREIEGTLHSVRVASASLVKSRSVGHVEAVLHLH